MQLPKHSRQFLRWNMKQRGIGEDPIEVRIREIELKKILLPHVAVGVGAGHCDETAGALEPNCGMAQLAEGREIAPRAAPEIENDEWWHRFHMPQQRRDVLIDVMVAGARPKGLGTSLIVRKRLC